MKQYKRYNIIIGWAIFLIASFVYLSTIEPTSSLWDCGEFIACGYKLEIPHPPGATFFMLLARFFSLFAPGTEYVALMVNAMSGLASAFTILFLFWTITHLAKKTVAPDNNFDTGKYISIFGSAIVGSLAFTFSDTFWFSAAEGEVYALSALFTAIVFWAILKWENEADDEHSTRWLILIAYLMGISIGVHLLNLLAIPPIVMVFYFRKYPVTRKGVIKSLLISMLILGTFMYLIIPGVAKVGTVFELLFVNGFGLPYNSGLIVYVFLIIALISWGLLYTHKARQKLANTILLMLSVVLIGYSSYAMIVIRSSANPPIDQNNPDNIFALLKYLNREQYGSRPLVRGPYFNAPITGDKKGAPIYDQVNGKYEVIGHKTEYVYDPEFITIFPRMFSRDGNDVRGYRSWAGIDPPPKTADGEDPPPQKPTFGQNLKFFFNYQIGHMYLRYFMWNFSGRQNDEQGHGDILNGNWISGIKFIDQIFLGNQEELTESMKNHPSRNTYYMLPLILGLIGLFYHYNKDNKNFWIILLLFFFTGIAIIIFLNQPPFEPRERDYTYAGSFYAFCIWISFGVLSIIDTLRKKIPLPLSAGIASVLCLIFVPGIMAKENWDDHDRSGKYTARDHAFNYLNTCAPNALLFTHGDNDTFPLWYAQEVEGIRTDVRVVNMMLFNTPWYVDQMRYKAYESDPLPFTLPHDKTREGTNNVVYITDRIDKHIDIRRIIDFVANNDKETKLNVRGEVIDYIPTKQFLMEIDTAKVINNDILDDSLADRIESEIQWKINKRYLTKSELLLLDILAHNEWERPLYFVSPTSGNSLRLNDYFKLEGYAHQLIPVKTGKDRMSVGEVDTDVMYDNLMNKYKWGRMNEPDVYLGHYDRRTLYVLRLRHKFARLSEALIRENKKDSARMVMDRCVELMPKEKLPYRYEILSIARNYYRIDEDEKANKIINDFYTAEYDNLNYYLSLDDERQASIQNDIQRSVQLMQSMMMIARNNGQPELQKEIEDKLQSLPINLSGRQPRQ